jgi:hypothetical protein
MPAGRPPIWDDPEAFEKSVEAYFATAEITKTNPTWTGLALHLGFESRQSLQDYKGKSEFSYPIKKALARIEENYEQGLFSRNPAGAIFALKNFGWKDKQEVEQSGGLTIKFEEPTDYIYPTQDQGDNGIPESL